MAHQRKDLEEAPDLDEPEDNIVELNLQHRGALEGAEERFTKLYQQVVTDATRPPDRISKSYFSCQISHNEKVELLRRDKSQNPKDRSIYRIWPDFEVNAFVDRSVTTIKADAARRAFAAGGKDITWAVIDSGIDKGHPHFRRYHNVDHEDVADLHRDFTVRGEAGKDALKEGALTDEFGHGTHVAGIIAGAFSRDQQKGGEDQRNGQGGQQGAPPEPLGPLVFEKVLESESDTTTLTQRYEQRRVEDETLLAGVAPECKLVSLKVLGSDGTGRASDIMRALVYIREQVNADPKVLRIHGVNISSGYPFNAEAFACGQSPLCVEVDRLVRAGVVVVVASGNTGFGDVAAAHAPGAGSYQTGLVDTIMDPGNAALAITVGSTHRYMPHTYGVSFFSSKGPTNDGRLKPDLVAPGERVTSCAAGSYLRNLQYQIKTQGEEQEAQSNGDQSRATDQASDHFTPAPEEIPDGAAVYVDDSGTSMAAPHVSGAIAAFLSIRREFIQKPEDVKRIFLDSATSLGRDKYFEGHGLLDLMRAIQSV